MSIVFKIQGSCITTVDLTAHVSHKLVCKVYGFCINWRSNSCYQVFWTSCDLKGCVWSLPRRSRGKLETHTFKLHETQKNLVTTYLYPDNTSVPAWPVLSCHTSLLFSFQSNWNGPNLYISDFECRMEYIFFLPLLKWKDLKIGQTLMMLHSHSWMPLQHKNYYWTLNQPQMLFFTGIYFWRGLLLQSGCS